MIIYQFDIKIKIHFNHMYYLWNFKFNWGIVKGELKLSAIIAYDLNYYIFNLSLAIASSSSTLDYSF